MAFPTRHHTWCTYTIGHAHETGTITANAHCPQPHYRGALARCVVARLTHTHTHTCTHGCALCGARLWWRHIRVDDDGRRRLRADCSAVRSPRTSTHTHTHTVQAVRRIGKRKHIIAIFLTINLQCKCGCRTMRRNDIVCATPCRGVCAVCTYAWLCVCVCVDASVTSDNV